jgi:hypothetical protein
MTALAEKLKPLERVAPKIDPNRVTVNVDGFAFRVSWCACRRTSLLMT